MRYDDWKLSFLRQNSVGFKVWEPPFEELRWPMLTNLRMDPFERATTKSDRTTSDGPLSTCSCSRPQAPYVGQWLQSFREFPPRMKPGSFSLDRVMEAVTDPIKAATDAALNEKLKNT